MSIQNNPKTLQELDEKEVIFIQKIKSLSDENRKKLKRFIEIILNEDELQTYKNEDGSHPTVFVQDIAIPLKLLERECSLSSLREAETLVNKLNQFSDVYFITFENRNMEDIFKSINWNDERVDRKNDNKYYTDNLLVILNNPTILKKILGILDGNTTDIITVSKVPIFNEEKSTLIILGCELNFPKQSNQFLMLNLLLNKYSGKETDKTTILDSHGWKNPENERSPYDTMKAINKKVSNGTQNRIKELIKHRGSEYFWIDTEQNLI